MRLDIIISNLMTRDELTVELNGESLAGAPIQRTYEAATYSGQRISFELMHSVKTRPSFGSNTVVVALRDRPATMADKGVALMSVECRVDWGDRYASRL